MKIVVLDGYALNPGDISWSPVEALGELTIYERTAPEQVVERIGDAPIILTNKTIISKEVMDACPNLKYVGVLATGYNVVDLEAARQKNIIVTNVPGYSSQAVAQFVFALLLEACCHVQQHSDSVHAGDWVTSKDFCYWKSPQIELWGKTFAIFGYGSIGKSVAAIAQALGMKVVCCTRTPSKIPQDSGIIPLEFDEFLATADVISLHSPLTPQTENLICADSIAKMKQGVIIINTARGPLVQEQDMAAALKSGQVGWYAADVVCKEPMAQDNPLLGIPNCIITPHIAWATQEARSRLMAIAADNIKGFQQGNPVNVVSKN